MKIFIIATLLAVAAASQYGPPPAYPKPAPQPSYPRPAPAPAPAYPAPAPQPAYPKPAPAYPAPAPAPYSFEWAVLDAASANDFNHKQSSDGQNTNAVYRTLLPDGRVQVVSIKVAGDSGSIADVQYEAAKYAPAPAPAYRPAPAPAPAPVYRPAPAPAPAYPAPPKY